MQPNYYLLRDNLESGPYTIDELLLQGLKPTDLVWVEGRTNAWCHPSELEELTVSFSINKEKLKSVSRPAAPQRTRQSISRNSDEDIEKRAEEIRKSILSQSVTSHRLELKEDDPGPTYYRLPEESIELVVHRKKITLPGAHATAAGIMLVFIAAAWYGKDVWVDNSRFLDAVAKPFESKTLVTIPEKKETGVQNSFSLRGLTEVQDSSVQQLVAVDSSAAKAETAVSYVNVPSRPVSTYRKEDSDTASNLVQAVNPVAKKEDSARLDKKNTEEKKEPVKKEVDQRAVENKNPEEKPQAEVKKPVEIKKETEPDQTAEMKEEAPKKKKGFLGGLFKKKKKNDEE